MTDTEKTQSEKRKSLFYTQRRIRESIFKITKKNPLFENEEINEVDKFGKDRSITDY